MENKSITRRQYRTEGFGHPSKRAQTKLRVALYARVLTHDQQTIPMQARATREYATRRGWRIALQVKEIGSGAAQREKRELRLDAARRREIDVVLVWRLDRRGRSVTDLLATLQEPEHLGVGFVSLTGALDLTTPAGRAMAGLLAVFAEFEREIMRERVCAGLEHARRNGQRLGRPRTAALHADQVRKLYRSGISKSAIARRFQIGRTSVRRILNSNRHVCCEYCIMLHQIARLSGGIMRIFRAVCLLIFGLTPMLSAQDNVEEMKKSLIAKYVGKVVTLRHFYSGSKILFNADGRLAGVAGIGPWTICAKVQITNLDLNEKRLKLRGPRIFLYFDREQKIMIGLRANQAQANQLKLTELRIEIPLIKQNGREAALNAALDSIFLKDTENLVNFVPQFWELFLSGKTVPGKVEQDSWYKAEIKSGETGVVAPQLTRNSLPRYTEEARMFRCEGVVLLAGVVDKDTGKMRDVQIVVPLGLGLEESAISALENWRFTPGRRNGQPVSIKANIEVSFRLY